MMRRAVASCRATGVASNPLRSRAVASHVLRDQPHSTLLSTVRPRKIVAFPTSARFASLRRAYAAKAAPQDVSEEEKQEIARRKQQGKTVTPKASIQQRRIVELFQSANGCITEEKWTQAEDKFNTILDLQPTGTDTLFGRVLMNLAFVEHNLGKREKAAQHYGEGLTILKQTLGKDSEEVGRGLLNYAESLAFLTKLDQAEAASKEALPVFEKHYGPNHELVGALLSNMGGYLCAQSKLEEAQPIIKRALEILDRTLGRHNEFTTAVLTNYTRLLSDLGLNDQLNELKAKYSSNTDTFLAFDSLYKDSNDPKVQAMVEEFRGLAQGRAFDPPGMFKSEAFHKEELKEFIKQWEAKHQGRLDPDLIPAVLEELEGIPREELDKMWADAAGELIASKRGREGVPSLDAIAESIDAEALEAEDGEAGDETDDDEQGESDETDSDEEGDEEEDDEDDEEVEKLGADDGEDEGDLWRATEANERKAAKNVEVDMSHVELRDDAPTPSKK